MSVQWIPSNGTEGYQFTIDWCSRCARDAVCNGQKTFDDCDDSELCQILSAAFRGTAKECWAQYIGDAIRVELMQDADLFEPSGDLKQSVERLRNMAKEDGTTVTISAGGRSVTL